MKKYFNSQLLGILAGPLAFLLMELWTAPSSMSHEAQHILATALWMGIWWTANAVPIAITALLPIIIFPLTGVLTVQATIANYGHKYIFLYLGGFILAIAMEKWQLHRRIALHIIHFIGTGLYQIVLGFMLATAFLSMWISNTATTVMMMPIGMAVIAHYRKHQSDDNTESEQFGKILMLAIAYSSSIGGIATLIGTAPNLVLAAVLQENYGITLTFVQWMKIGLPVSLILLFVCWYYLTRFAFRFKSTSLPGGKAEIQKLKNALGRMGREETTVALVFVSTAMLWMTRSYLQAYLPHLDDSIIALVAAISLFVLPSRTQARIMDWEDCKEIPWSIILLFGGGLALAQGFKDSGLATWIANELASMHNLPLFLVMMILFFVINFLTEFTSNLSTTAMLLPVLVPLTVALEVQPYMILVGVTMSASCAFMLPVATPPNAVIFAAGQLTISDMIKAGFFMNLISILLITVLLYFMLPVLWGF